MFSFENPETNRHFFRLFILYPASVQAGVTCGAGEGVGDGASSDENSRINHSLIHCESEIIGRPRVAGRLQKGHLEIK